MDNRASLYYKSQVERHKYQDTRPYSMIPLDYLTLVPCDLSLVT